MSSDAETEAIRRAFAAEHGVTPYRNSRLQVARVLRSAGAPEPEVLDVLDWIGLHGAIEGPFDHGDVWGAYGRPRIIVGHPYHLDEAGRHLLDAIRKLGLEVRTDGRSYYGFGTLQVLVFAKPPNVADELARRRNCRSGLEGVRMRHVPTGREFECGGSEWGPDSRLSLVIEPGWWDAGRKPTPDDLGILNAGDVELSHYHPAKVVPASECVLLGRWPVVCCRPGRRRCNPRPNPAEPAR